VPVKLSEVPAVPAYDPPAFAVGATSAAAIVAVALDVPIKPLVSVTFSVTVYVPADA
jgi:hypothetical protein